MDNYLEKILRSSIIVTFLIGIGWSVAYSYGWAQSFYYQFPWELVEVGIPNIARSLGYVLFISIIISFVYIVGLYIIRKAKDHFSDRFMNRLRVFIIFTALSSPIVLQAILLIQHVSAVLLISYTLIAITIPLFVKLKYQSISPQNLNRLIKRKKLNPIYIMLFIYLYFIVSAFTIGYFRPAFKHEYASLEIEHQKYYILAKSNNFFVLSKNISTNNNIFFTYPCIEKPITICKFEVEKLSVIK
ncbi:hypothetical protein L4F91_04045 [Avibacterium sp. 20-126]|uniref:hypothetical protein n=1 Tax=Avibacterium sp. 20-126 TaxID=2911524 RepID=UPI002189C26C|nr:hypothetical protein L4F91_04045 [Avibacterium sp. 20-126]